MNKIVNGFRENHSIVKTIKGAKFWGRLIGFHALGTDNPGAVVHAIDPGFVGTRHVYPLAQLALRPEGKLTQLQILEQWIWNEREKHGEHLAALGPAFDLILNKIDDIKSQPL